MVFPPDLTAVRRTLHDAARFCASADVPEPCRSSVDIVLAEVLNNIVEHAFAKADGGVVDLELCHRPDAVQARVRDDGGPMPGETLPAGAPAALGSCLSDLPEGGFGWHLIRVLTSELTYRREGGWNVTCFAVPVDPPNLSG